jgi:hypothetical protein
VTIEDLERGMKLLFDQHVHSSERLDRIEELQQKAELEMAQLRALQEKAELEMAELRTSEGAMMGGLAGTMDGLKRLAHVVTGIAESQRHTTETQQRTEAIVAALAEDLRNLARRMDAFIAALRNGHQESQ